MSFSSAARLSRAPLSPAARAMRLQRVFARLQEGAGYAEIAAEEGVSRQRLGQIIGRARALRRDGDQPDHIRMQIARLTPALRLAAAGVAEGDAKAIPLLLSLVDRLDRYSDPDMSFRSVPIEEIARSRPRRIGRSEERPSLDGLRGRSEERPSLDGLRGRSEERPSFDGLRAGPPPAAAAPEPAGEPSEEQGDKRPAPIAGEPSA